MEFYINEVMKLLGKPCQKFKSLLPRLKNFYLKARNTKTPLNDQVKIKIELYDKISVTTKLSVDEAFKKVFNRTLSEHIIKWAKPHWIVLGSVNNKLVSICLIVVETNVLFDETDVRVGGIGGVLTLHSYRGIGIAQKILKHVDSLLFNVLNVDCGLLICGKQLLNYYKRMRWYEVNCKLYYRDGNDLKLCEYDVMLKSKKEKYQPDIIEVSGKLW